MGGVTRRSFLRSVAGTGALVVVGPGGRASATGVADPLAAALAWRQQRLAQPLLPRIAGSPTRTIRWVRAADQLDVMVELYGCDVVGDQIVATGADPGVRFVFGSQHTAERVWNATSSLPITAMARASAGPSSLVVPLAGSVPLTPAGLVGLVADDLVVTASAAAPTGRATELEIPTGLVLSPVAGATVRARSVALTRSDVTEVFVAEVVAPGGGSTDVRATANLSPTDLFTRTPNATTRDALVLQSTTSSAVEARRLWLSSSGAFAHLRGSWTTGTVRQWRQRIVTGRDLHVDVITAGYLAPFGIPASLSNLANRGVIADAGGGWTSGLTTRKFITVLEPEVDLSTRQYQPHDGRHLPFVRISATVDESTPVTTTNVEEGGSIIRQVYDLWREPNGARVNVHYVAVDREGNEVSFSMPATFVVDDVAYSKGTNTAPQRLIRAFNADPARSQVNLRGQALALAAPGLEATTKETHRVSFELLPATGSSTQLTSARVPAFAAGVAQARVADELIGRTLGTPADAFDVVLHPRWIQHGNGAGNFDQSFLKLLSPKTGRVGGRDSAVRAVAKADLSAEVFNQRSGFGPDLPTASASWDPTSYIGADARLLGTLKLADLLESIANDVAVPGDDVPGTETVEANDLVTTTLSMQSKLKPVPALGFLASPTTKCSIAVTSVTSRSGAEPDKLTTAISVNDFDMVFPPGNVIELIVVTFDKVRVTVSDDGPVKCDPTVKDWRLGEELNFLQPLLDTLSDAQALTAEILELAINLGLVLNLPALSMGMVRLDNFKIGASLELPFGEDPLKVGVDVGFPADPIDIAVAIFGGSFHCGLDLEFGDGVAAWKVNVGVSVFVEIDVDVVVAEIAVTVRAALSFVFDKGETGTAVKVTGSISLEGVIEIFGCLSVSAKLIGTASYDVNREKMVLRGTVEWDIDTPIGGLHGHIELGEYSFELGNGRNRALVGSGPGEAVKIDPDAHRPSRAALADRNGFGDMYSPAGWSEYCAAFA